MSKVLNLLIHTSVVSSLLIMSIFILRFVFKNKISPRLQYALWIIVAVRLIIPFNFEWTLETETNLPQNHILEFMSENNIDHYERNQEEY